jgi:hypothetical protein
LIFFNEEKASRLLPRVGGGVCVTYRRVFDWKIVFLATLRIPFATTGNYSAIAISTLYSSLLYPLLSSGFTSRILTTDSLQSHCHIKSHMRFSLHSLIPFFPLLWQLPTAETRLNPNSSQSLGQNDFTTGDLRPISSSWRYRTQKPKRTI